LPSLLGKILESLCIANEVVILRNTILFFNDIGIFDSVGCLPNWGIQENAIGLSNIKENSGDLINYRDI